MKKLVMLIASLCIVSSCTEEPKVETTSTTTTQMLMPPSKVRLEQICRSYAKGDFITVVESMHSCQNKPKSYVVQMKNLLKQRLANHAKDSIRINDYQTNQIVMHDSQSSADIYLEIAYSNGQQEEIMLPMIYDEGKWWIK